MFGKCKGKQGFYYRKLLSKFANGFVCIFTFIKKKSYSIVERSVDTLHNHINLTLKLHFRFYCVRILSMKSGKVKAEKNLNLVALSIIQDRFRTQSVIFTCCKVKRQHICQFIQNTSERHWNKRRKVENLPL